MATSKQAHCLLLLLMMMLATNFSPQMDTRRYADAVFVSTFNMTVIVVATLLVIWHTVAKDRMLFRPSELPTLWKATTDFIFCAIFDDIGFYYLHR